MFKKFDEKESISGQTQLKSSVQKAIRAKISDAYPQLAEGGYFDEILPKKDAFRVIKCHDHIELLVNSVMLVAVCRSLRIRAETWSAVSLSAA